MDNEPYAPYRVALVGIDGTGKTTVAQRLQQRTARDGQFAVLRCIQGQENPDGPLHTVSHALERAARIADHLDGYDLKLALLYLQMCMYGPTERFFVDAMRPQIVVSDRHPVVDALVYLPLYQQLLAQAGKESKYEQWLALLDPETRRAVLAWHDAQARRLDRRTALPDLPAELVETLCFDGDRQVVEVAARFQTELPDAIVLLDVDIDQALGRLADRRRAPELHQTRRHLEAVRQQYEKVLSALQRSPEALIVHQVDNSGRTPDDTVDEILEWLALKATVTGRL